MKKLIALFLATLMVFALSSTAFGDELPDYNLEIKFNVVGGEASLQSQSLAKFAELVKEKTNGNITITCFFNAQLADNKTAPIMVSDGSIDMTSGCGTSWMSDYVPALGFATAPYVFESGAHWQAVFNSDIFGDLVQQFEDKLGVKVLGFQYLGDRNVVSNIAASTPEEFGAINMRVPTTQAYLDAAEVIGCSATAMSLNEVYLALQTGTVDAVEQALDSVISYNFQEVTKYLIMTQHMFDNAGVIINRDLWNSIPEVYQDIILSCIAESNAWLYETKLSDEEIYKQKILDAGLELIEPDITLFMERAAELVYPKYAETWGEGTIDAVRALAPEA